MNDNLFDLPETSPDPLQVARRRYEEASKNHALADDWQDHTGEAIPTEIEEEYKAAREHLARAEAAELEGRRRG